MRKLIFLRIGIAALGVLASSGRLAVAVQADAKERQARGRQEQLISPRPRRRRRSSSSPTEHPPVRPGR